MNKTFFVFYKLVAICLLTSCFNENKSHQLQLSSVPRNTNHEVGEFNVFFQELEVKDDLHAQQFIKGRLEYFKSHFVDSYDPYFGVKTVPDWCHEKLFFLSDLYKDKEGFWSYGLLLQDLLRNIGCKEQASQTVFIIRYCKKQKFVRSYWIRLKNGDDLNLQPITFTCEGILSYSL